MRNKDRIELRVYSCKIGGETLTIVAYDMGSAEEQCYRVMEDMNPGSMVERIDFVGWLDNQPYLTEITTPK